MSTLYKHKVIALVNQIPQGKVTNFGSIAKQVGIRAQLIGWILSGLSTTECDGCCWYRVVAKDGFISSLKLGTKGFIQKQILIEQGYDLVGEGKNQVNMAIHFWDFDNDESDLLLDL